MLSHRFFFPFTQVQVACTHLSLLHTSEDIRFDCRKHGREHL